MTSDRPGPRSDDDTFAIVDQALADLAARRVDWIADDLTAIGLVTSLVEQLDRCLPDLVTTARLNGHSWHDIAYMLATSPNQARLRFAPDSPIADTRWPYDQ